MVSSALLTAPPVKAQFGIGHVSVCDDPDFLNKVHQRNFAALEQTAVGKAQAYVLGWLADKSTTELPYMLVLDGLHEGLSEKLRMTSDRFGAS